MKAKIDPFLINVNASGVPKPTGLYDPQNDHDSCGVGFIARIDGVSLHTVVEHGIRILVNLEHRGALGGDKSTGDGAGLLLEVPDTFLRQVCPGGGLYLPPRGEYAVGMLFLPMDEALAGRCSGALEQIAAAEGCPVLGWREVPVDPSFLGDLSGSTRPRIRQLFLGRGTHEGDAFERKLYVVRRLAEKKIASWHDVDASQFYISSLSSRTIVYKGLLTGSQLPRFYPDLKNELFMSPYAVVHQRYSTNTLPTWHLAHPFRIAAHNGEINTLRGNINRMRAREAILSSPLFGGDIAKLRPIINESGSDSAIFDNVLELLVMSGRSLPHAVMMMIPEAWGPKFQMSEDKRSFYEYHSAIMEPWDGPAAMVFCDGRYLGATLDRNGLRPARYTVTRDGMIVLASETGVMDFPPGRIVRRGRLQPGKMLLLDLQQKRIVPDNEIKAAISRRKPYRQWVKGNKIELRGLFVPSEIPPEDPETLRRKQHAFGYTEEEIKLIITPMASRGQEAIGSMGDDAALAVLSNRPQSLFAYFKQLFAQVTNPPIDPLREELVMSLNGFIGRERNLLDETPEHCRMLRLIQPILTPEDMLRLRGSTHPDLAAADLDMLFPAGGDGKALETALARLFVQADKAIRGGATLLILTDRNMNAGRAPIPSLLATAGLHHHLIRRGLRTQASIVVESGEPREVIHFALLLGYGAAGGRGGGQIRHLGEEGAPQDLQPDGHLHPSQLSRLPDLRGGGTGEGAGGKLFHQHGLPHRRDRAFRGRRGNRGAAPARLPDRRPLAERGQPSRRGRRLPGPGRRRAPPVDPGIGLQAPERDPAGRLRDLQGVRGAHQRPVAGARHAALAVPLPQGNPGPPQRGGADRKDPAALRHRGDVVRLHQQGDPRDDRHRDEPDRRAEQFRGRGRGSRTEHSAPERGQQAVPDPPGRLGALRRDHRVPGERRRAADQDGAGGQARRGRAAPRPQGEPRDRQDPPHDAVRDAHLAAAAPRHLLHRGSRAAHLRPEIGQPAGERLRQARFRGRGRNDRGRGRQGEGRSRAHRGERRGHGRLAAHFHQAHRAAVGARVGRDPAGSDLQPASRPDHGAGRRAAEDRPGPRHRGADGGGGVRVRHGGAREPRVHHDEEVPPEHLPGGGGDPGPGPARALRRRARIRRALPPLRFRGAARIHGGTRVPNGRRDGGPGRPAGGPAGGRALEGEGARLLRHSPASRQRTAQPAAPRASAGARGGKGPRLRDHGARAERAGPEGAGPDRAADPERPPVGGRGALRRDHPPIRGGGAARRRDPSHPPRLRGPELRGVSGARRHDARARGRQRLPRQRDVGGTDRRDPPGGGDLPSAQERDRRKRGALRRHGRRGVLPRDRRRAVRRPQQRRESRRGRRGRPRVRVHDRRGRRGAGAHGEQLRRRDERGARLRLRRDGAVRHPLQPRHGRRGERLAGGGCEAPPRHDREPLPLHGQPAGRADPRKLGVPPPPLRQDHADRVPEVAGADAHGGGDEHRERLRHRGGLPWLSRPGSWNTIGRNRRTGR